MIIFPYRLKLMRYKATSFITIELYILHYAIERLILLFTLMNFKALRQGVTFTCLCFTTLYLLEK